jgi:hypothetical protein
VRLIGSALAILKTYAPRSGLKVLLANGLDVNEAALRVAIKNTDGLLARTATGLGMRRAMSLEWNRSASTNTSQYANYGASAGNAGRGFPCFWSGRVIAQGITTNIATVFTGSDKVEFQVYDNGALLDDDLDVEITSADSGNVNRSTIFAAGAAFAAGALLQSRLVFTGASGAVQNSGVWMLLEFDVQ